MRSGAPRDEEHTSDGPAEVRLEVEVCEGEVMNQKRRRVPVMANTRGRKASALLALIDNNGVQIVAVAIARGYE